MSPVSRNQHLGEMTIRCGEQVLAQIPLVAAESVERLSWLDIFTRLLGKVSLAG